MPQEESFFDKFMEARDAIKGRKKMELVVIDSQPMPPQMPPMAYDGQGDGPVGGSFTPSPVPVGPDLGPDTEDAKLTPGEFVMNQEATQMYGPQIEQMNQAGLVARAEGGPIYRQGGGRVDPFSVLDKYTSVGVPGVGGKVGLGVGGGTVGYERPAFGGDFSVGVTPGVGYDNYGQPSVQPSWNVGWRKEFNRCLLYTSPSPRDS